MIDVTFVVLIIDQFVGAVVTRLNDRNRMAIFF